MAACRCGYKNDEWKFIDGRLQSDFISTVGYMITEQSIVQEETKPVIIPFDVELEIDGEIVDQYRGDGLIFSTPTGSTAYAMASGGPILHPDIEAIVVSAICPMSLSSRPVVVPATSQLIIKPIGI